MGWTIAVIIVFVGVVVAIGIIRGVLLDSEAAATAAILGLVRAIIFG